MALGKNTTIGELEEIIRTKTATIDDKKISQKMLIDLINFNVSELAKKLSEVNAPFYMSESTLTLSGSIYPISTLAIDIIIKLTDSSLGHVEYLSPRDYERLTINPIFSANSLFYTVEGEEIRIFKGSALGAHSTLTLKYYRQPTFATAVSQYPDLPDSYTSILIKMVCSDIYAYKNAGQRDVNKDKEIQTDIRDMKKEFLKAA